MSALPIHILKLGSSVLRSRRDLPKCVHEIYRSLREGRRVIAVVSAFEGVTDALSSDTLRGLREPDPYARASYIATGEARSAALLALALERAGVTCEVFDSERLALRAHGTADDADPVDIDLRPLLESLATRSVAIVPGFVARDAERRTVLLGRGGSDLTALFLASHLRGADVRLLKDVDGVYERDPAEDPCGVARYAELSIDDALALGGAIVQPKALRFAREHALTFEVASVGSPCGTRVGAAVSRIAPPSEPPRALRVTLLGLGTVGLGVYRELARRPEAFEVRQVLVRRRSGRPQAQIPRSLLVTELAPELLDGSDVLIELLGADEPAHTLVRAALERGIDVVTANKPLVVEHGRELGALAERCGATLSYSAAVGGAVPMLETLAALGPRVRGFEGVLNSTTNFVLDRLAAGSSIEAAVASASARGFCEANPWVDLSGADAAHKLELAARVAFGDEVQLAWLERRGIDALDPSLVRSAAERGARVRLVASCSRANGRVEARLAPVELQRGELLAEVCAEHNALVIATSDGERVVVTGKGAGRWPTTEAVLGDLFALARRASNAELEAV